MAAFQAGPVRVIRSFQEVAPPKDHHFSKLVRAYLNEVGIDPQKIEEQPDLNVVRWHFITETMSAFVVIYQEDESGEVFVKLECAFADFSSCSTPEIRSKVMEWLLVKSQNLHFPFRLVLLSDNGAVATQFYTYCSGITAEHFALRLRTLLPFSAQVLSELESSFSVKPFLKPEDNS